LAWAKAAKSTAKVGEITRKAIHDLCSSTEFHKSQAIEKKAASADEPPFRYFSTDLAQVFC
jgi:hypothetical protein